MSIISHLQASGAHPTTWDDFIGQEPIKDLLRTAAASARVRSELLGHRVAMDHMLIVSPEPGSGKTTLAMLAATEAGVSDKAIRFEKGVITEAQALKIFFELGDGGVLIWDEFQQAVTGNKKHIEWLYQYLQQGVISLRGEMIAAPKVTIIGATTHVGALPFAVKQRFKLLNLAPYTETEALHIARSTWMNIGTPLGLPMPDDDTCEAVARAASGRARYMQEIWKSVRDDAVTGRLSLVGDDEGECRIDLADYFTALGLTPDGLTTSALSVMRFLYENNDRPRGRETVGRATGVTGFDLEEAEDLLLTKGYVTDTGQGRALTGAGINRFQAELAVAA